jgi:hypothetical protein
MNHLKLFENFNREQPLEKEDVQNLLEGTGINWTYIYEYPIRNIGEKEFYLGWIVLCDNPEEWVYNTPKNYQVNIFNDYLEFQWKVKSDMDLMLSKITPKWKEIKMWLLDLFNGCEKRKTNDGFNYYKDNNLLFEQDLKNQWFFISYVNLWLILIEKYSIYYIDVEAFLWIILEYWTNYKAVRTYTAQIRHRN